MEVSGLRGPLRTAQLLLLLVAAACRGQVVMNDVVGGNVTLVAKYTGTPTEINWKVNGDKYVDMELIPSLSTMFYRNKERSSIEKNGTLTIKDLSKKDNGTYKAEVLIDNRFQETDYKLTVYDPVSKPSITDYSTKEKINVTCTSADSAVNYEWLNSAGELVSTGPTYVVTPRPKGDVTITCVVSNPASENRTTETIKPNSEPKGWIAAVVLVPLLLLLVFLALLLLWCYNQLDKICRICSCFGPPGENCAVKRIDGVFRACGLKPKGEDLERRDGDAEQGKMDVNKTRGGPERGLLLGHQSKGTNSENKNDGIEKDQETQAENTDDGIEKGTNSTVTSR